MIWNYAVRHKTQGVLMYSKKDDCLVLSNDPVAILRAETFKSKKEAENGLTAFIGLSREWATENKMPFLKREDFEITEVSSVSGDEEFMRFMEVGPYHKTQQGVKMTKKKKKNNVVPMIQPDDDSVFESAFDNLAYALIAEVVVQVGPVMALMVIASVLKEVISKSMCAERSENLKNWSTSIDQLARQMDESMEAISCEHE